MKFSHQTRRKLDAIVARDVDSRCLAARPSIRRFHAIGEYSYAITAIVDLLIFYRLRGDQERCEISFYLHETLHYEMSS